MITGLGDPDMTLPSIRCESASKVEGGDGEGAAPSTRNPTTLIAGCVWLTEDSLLLGAGLLSIDCVLSLLGICTIGVARHHKEAKFRRKLPIRGQFRHLRLPRSPIFEVKSRWCVSCGSGNELMYSTYVQIGCGEGMQ